MAGAASGRGRSYRAAVDRRFGVSVGNGAETRRALVDVGGDVADLKAAHKTAAKVVENKAKQIAPVSKVKKTGLNRSPNGSLRKSIRSSVTKGGAEIRSGWQTASKRHSVVQYAGVIEYGWPQRNIKPNRFMRRATLANLGPIRRIYQDAVIEAFRKQGLEVS